ncbi:DNA-damage inducible protein DDI1-like protein,putative [Trypanosoma brucei gambiense DAL972]|uniref:DNA-damage inducible protein DDI1-like protein,putative n=1 Tax=Trypanosoma brucei gambiense (strain MHOM/CI/86/DAL972) TaxID=679716 RepID=C9ZXL3_TRYB9|nr:DNA-damage inducible protein DDI1-like protein,putative [Trypanosoma brucei gambiense DAL972]CBH14157.1 DNA-damage inducible protein DDI1-like protein,putative [Trypanosoma brucei gambiense DAL972]|eukprot:XP_011776428.1 DNA-damage inducible protein DDI1-like protein,putative [Trypanosoma brucei gambiense DAL972]
MKITCTDESGNVYSAELDPTAMVEDLSVLVEVEIGIPVEEQLLMAPTGVILRLDETFGAQGITTDCCVTVRRQVLGGGLKRPAEERPDRIPEVHASEERSHILELYATELMSDQDQLQQLVSPEFDETDPAIQSRIYEEISKRNVEENLANALEFAPEAFTRVSMLHVTVEINKVKVKALVDCGAQTSVVSAATAERCGINWLVDKRAVGTVHGVGEQRSLGRIHLTQANLGGLFIPISLVVLESETFDLIIGLDQMKKHRMIIDLKDDCLRVGGTAIPFLSDSEVSEEPHRGTPFVLGGGDGNEDNNAAEVPTAGANQGTAAKRSTAPSGPNISSAEKEQAIETFVSLTHLERQQAIALLEAVNWNPHAAMSLLMEE